MDADQLRADIGRSMVQFIAGAVLNNQAVTARVGLGASDAQFMSLLSVHGPLAPGRFAELTGLTTGTVTGVLDRLEKAGYVRRERDPGDRRKVLVIPVPEAMAALAEHYRAHGERTDALLRTRTPDQLRVIAEFFAELVGSGSSSGSGSGTSTSAS